MKISQREKVLRAILQRSRRAIVPGDLAYADVPGCCAGLYQFAGVTRFGPLLLGDSVALLLGDSVALLLGDSVATVNWSEILPPF